jgi:Fe-S cluster assembly ATP-binding protein
MMKERMERLRMDQAFAGRYLNEGFSGGEKKRAEILQMAILEPKIAIMDETDSGLDIDALRIVAEGAVRLHALNKMGVLVITHYQRILNYVQPDFVHIMLDGRIVETGGPELALQLEESGYDWLREKYGAAEAV